MVNNPFNRWSDFPSGGSRSVGGTLRSPGKILVRFGVLEHFQPCNPLIILEVGLDGPLLFLELLGVTFYPYPQKNRTSNRITTSYMSNGSG